MLFPVKSWFSDAAFRRLFKHAGVLLSGSVAASLLAMLALALSARGLGANEFGTLVLISTYVLIIDQLVNFQSWQALIKYGADAIESDARADLAALLKFGFVVDGSTAIIGAAVAVAGVFVLSAIRDMPESVFWLAVLYSLTIVFHVSGTPTAILRLFGKFQRLAMQEAAVAGFRCTLILVAFILDGGLPVFVIAWALSDVFGRLLLVHFSLGELSNQGLIALKSVDLSRIATRFPGIWRFLWTTNITLSLRSSIRELDILIVGGALGDSNAGLFRIVKSAAKPLNQIASSLYAAIYPELARFAAENQWENFRQLALRASLVSGVLGVSALVALVATGELVISAIIGMDYLPAYHPMLVYLGAYVIWMFCYPLSGAVLALGRPEASLLILVLSLFVYFPLLLLWLPKWGLVGASAATVAFYSFWAVSMFIVVGMAYKQKRKTSAVS